MNETWAIQTTKTIHPENHSSAELHNEVDTQVWNPDDKYLLKRLPIVNIFFFWILYFSPIIR